MGYVAITAKIIELLNEIKEEAGIEVIYDHEPNALGGYPAVTVVALGHKNRFGSIGVGGDNIRSYQYIIRVWYRLSDDDTAENVIQDITDRILAKLEANVGVAGIWQILRPTESVFRTADREVSHLVSETTVTIEQRVARNV